MFKSIFLTLAFALFSFTISANTDNPESVTLCSGEKMTWEMYLLNKKLLSYKYDLEIESVEFIAYSNSVANNQTGSWSSVVDMPLISVAAAHLPDGRIMTWSARDKFAFGGDLGRTWTCIFDPVTNSSTEALITNTGHDMFCPATNLLPDGRIMVNGGSSSSKTSIYDPMTNGWSTEDELNISRGYHSGLTHSSGATYVVGGSWSGGVGNKNSEIWTEKTGWYELPGVPSIIATDGVISNQQLKEDDYFPWLWNAPNGLIFHAGPSPKMHWIDPTGVGSWSQAGNRSDAPYSTTGMSVMYDIGKILTMGGAADFESNTPSHNKCYTIDINTDNAIAAPTSDMAFSRAYGNSVVLPDGQVFAIGGQGVTAVFTDNQSRMVPELWNPETGLWTNMEPLTIPRNYHSAALLLTDGRVFVGGGGLCDGCAVNHPNAQIFSPPYLFNNSGGLKERPLITSAPTETDWNTNMVVNSNTTISEFVLVRQTAVTHSTSTGQRRTPLTSTLIGNNQYSVDIPNKHILPPGNYMLFAFGTNGAPSVAKVINIGDDINDCTPMSHPNLGGTGLLATYYNNIDFTEEVIQRIDPTVNFIWGVDSPAPSIDAETFSVKWEGRIRVPRDGYYTFYTNSDDGIRLKVNGRDIVDNWTLHGPTEDRGFIELLEGQDYNIEMEYFENFGGAALQLSWSGPGINKSIIDQQYLFPPTPCSLNDYTLVCEQNINATGWQFANNCNVPVCFGDQLVLSVNPNPNPATWIGPNGYTAFGNDAFISANINSMHMGDYTATMDINGCIKSITITVSFGPGCDPCFGLGGDNDGDGLCANEDCDDNNANLPAPIGSSCDDGNAGTENDVILADGCGCEGTPIPCFGNGGDADGDGICADDDCDDNNANLPAPIGSSCDDGNAGTENDVILADGCGCEGTPIACFENGGDEDGDGVCADDDCDDNNADLPAPVGSSCDDGNAGTENDVILADGCGCEGTPIACFENGGDVDGDGVCADDDCNDNDPNLPTTAGTVCDDLDPNTENDVIQTDGCSCLGTPIDNTICQSTYLVDGNSVSFNGLTNPVNAVKIIDLGYNTYWECNSWDVACQTSEIINNIPPGDYYISLNTYDAGWNSICNIFELITITDDGGGCTDNDNDGVCAADDCNDNNADLPATVGSSCDDNNTNTNNDVIQADGCTCEGTPIDGGNTCAATYLVSGNSVSFSGLTNPVNAVKIIDLGYATYWECNSWADVCNSSEIINNIPPGDYYISLNTYDAGWNSICNIFELITITDDSGCVDNDNDGICATVDCDDNDTSLPAMVGSTCDDGDANTDNDVIQSDGCTCAGTPAGGCQVVVATNNGVITISGLLGTNAKIFNTNWEEQWGCNPWTGVPCNNIETYSPGVGTFYVSVSSADCNVFEIVEVGEGGCADTDADGFCDSEDCAPNNPDLPAPAGSTCNDFDSETTNDVIQSDGCTCLGTPDNGSDCNITYTVDADAITITGLLDPIVTARIVDNAYNPIWDCGTFAIPCNQIETIPNLSPGRYNLIFESFDAGWNLICSIEDNVEVGIAPLIGSENTEIKSNNANTNLNNERVVTNKIGTISLFPNPAKDILNISLSAFNADNVVIEIYNMFGQLIHTETKKDIQNTNEEINLVDFKNGVYNLSVLIDDQRMETKTFVVTK